MVITKKDLQSEVERLNKKYFSRSANELCVQGAYGGYQVQLTGKLRKDGKGYRGMGSGRKNITYGFQSARNTLADLWKSDSKGWIKSQTNRQKKGGVYAK